MLLAASSTSSLPLGGAALSINGNAFTTEGFDISGLNGERDGAQSRAINLGLNNVELGGLTLSGKYGSTIRETDFDSDSNFNGRLDNTVDTTEVTTETARIDARFTLARALSERAKSRIGRPSANFPTPIVSRFLGKSSKRFMKLSRISRNPAQSRRIRPMGLRVTIGLIETTSPSPPPRVMISMTYLTMRRHGGSARDMALIGMADCAPLLGRV